MHKSSYHNHTFYSDGKANFADYIKAAEEKDFSAIGFSDHSPVKIDSNWNMPYSRLKSYIQEIATIKQTYSGQIKIYTGIEADYIEGFQGPGTFKQMVDYTIGSVHYFKSASGYACFDTSKDDFLEQLKTTFDAKPEKMIGEYYRLMTQMVETDTPDIIGHMDLVMKFNQNRDIFDDESTWYKNLTDKLIEKIVKAGCIAEINTGAIIRGYCTDPYPSLSIIKKMNQAGIKLMLNSDAHHPDNLDGAYAEGIKTAKAAGVSELWYLSGKEWEKYSI